MIWLPVILILPYLILFLNYYFNLSTLKPFTVAKESSLPVSVVVACKNERATITGLLECLSVQDYPANLIEIIIVDDNSSDNTYNLAEEFSLKQSKIVLRSSGEGKKQAIIDGVMYSKSELVITTDADCRMDRRWISSIVSFHESDDTDLIICPVKLENGGGFLKKFQALEFLSLQGVTAAAANSVRPVMCNGANLAFSRSTYLRHSRNLHKETNTGDDIFLLHSIKREEKSKIRWLESKDALVKTIPPASLQSFIKQRVRWISKTGLYTDRDIITTGIITFVPVLLQVLYLAGAFINHEMIAGFFVLLIIKSIPDYLIIKNTAERYSEPGIIKWFLPAQVVYPFYVLYVVLSWLFQSRNSKSAIVSYPSPTGI
jgi:poly-beta-1,6-N-acetyl-D-glucosamine synthase